MVLVLVKNGFPKLSLRRVIVFFYSSSRIDQFGVDLVFFYIILVDCRPEFLCLLLEGDNHDSSLNAPGRFINPNVVYEFSLRKSSRFLLSGQAFFRLDGQCRSRDQYLVILPPKILWDANQDGSFVNGLGPFVSRSGTTISDRNLESFFVVSDIFHIGWNLCPTFVVVPFALRFGIFVCTIFLGQLSLLFTAAAFVDLRFLFRFFICHIRF
mmetsp:Transcript_4880/g.10772  ORF Transcript_4880/g.10772 Transcript_4880/m.10772 type:complete len:211 (+) Transcript_4880:438-1070(+)